MDLLNLSLLANDAAVAASGFLSSADVLTLIPAAPLIAAITIALFGKPFLKERSHIVTVAALAVSFLMSLVLLFQDLPHAAASAGESLGYGPEIVTPLFQWVAIGNINVQVALRADAISAIMLAMVTGVSLLVAIFASGYMHGDPGYPRFFGAVSLFVFSMCMLVLAPSFLMLFVFWEAVGLCSYLLIGFWFKKPSAAAAAKKAFVVNRIGDFGFILGIFLIWTTFGALDFSTVLGNPARLQQIATDNPSLITTICLLLFLGAMGKSAQFPLHVWLPDAMEGPTPVSALIHAATMVTAGVYMVARCTPLFVLAPDAQLVVGSIGAATALIAALTALTQTDLKRVMAYSTVSQLGYMFMGLGAAVAGPEHATFAVTAAMFHLFTHAYFKALLFLASGSVMHSMGDVIDMRRFSGLKHALPITHWTFACGAAALAGLPVLSGFWSKDDILAALQTAGSHGPHQQAFQIIFGVATLTALLTAFYTFRAYFLTFHGKEVFPEEAGHHPHDAPPAMAWPLRILAVCALGIGLVVGPITHGFANTMGGTPGLLHAESHGFHIGLMLMSAIVAVVGVGIAYLMYGSGREKVESLPAKFGPLYKLSLNKFYFDELFLGLIVLPLRGIAKLSFAIDQLVIDPLVDLCGAIPRWFSSIPKVMHNGLVSSYAYIMFAGLIVIVLFALQVVSS